MAETKQWRCENGHVLGMIGWNGSGNTHLMLYRHAVDLEAERPEQVDVIGPVHGHGHIRCDVEGCDSVVPWKANSGLIKKLLLNLSDSDFRSLVEKVHAVREEEHSKRVKKQSAFE